MNIEKDYDPYTGITFYWEDTTLQMITKEKPLYPIEEILYDGE